MKQIHPLKAGLAFGLILGGFHLFWAILVALSFAQAVIDFIFWLHFVKPVYVIEPFSLGIAAGLVAMTFCCGFVGAYVFSLIWNRLHSS